MGRQYDLTNVEEAQFINEVGEYTVKVISVTAGQTENKNPVEKVVFKDKDGLQISDEFVCTEKALWKMKVFAKALKLPTVTDTDDWVGRYVKIHVGTETYTKADNSKGSKLVIKKYEESPLTNTMAAPQATYTNDEMAQALGIEQPDSHFTM